MSHKLKYLSDYLEDSRYLKDLNDRKLTKNSIIITARYRTGSTYLYSLFANLPNVAAFNEPLHRDIIGWFDKDDLQSQTFKYKASHTQTFKGNYFSEYKSLERELFIRYYRSEFGTTNIVMSSMDEYDELKDYVAFLLSSHPDKLKVLQFNRINFRLSWIKANFPKALIVNLRRNPRDIYSSYLKLHLRFFDKEANSDEDLEKVVEGIGLNKELNALTEVLTPLFSLEDLNNYEKIYLLNQLSNLWADRFSDLVIEYESLVQDPVEVLSKITSEISNFELSFANGLIEPRKDRVNVWQEHQSELWFKECEAKCDNLIEQMLF